MEAQVGGIEKTADKARTATHPIRQVVQSLVPRTKPLTQTPSNFSNTYMSQIQNLAAIRIDELRRLGKLPRKGGRPMVFSLEPSTYKAYNAGRGSTPTYAKFDWPHYKEAITGGANAAEYTNGGMSGRIVVDPRNPNNYLIKLTDVSAWDLDHGRKTGNFVRDFMGTFGTKGSDPNTVRQEFYLSIPMNYQYKPGISKYGDYIQINQDEAKRIFQSYGY